ncbi:MAG: class I SAM-dependent methyltransferase [Candidatus Helarchaeota archaeon]|nr:class I SAM-dependent methyltransferase [Candidatus Helarchaeota archaeon]
MTQKDAEKFYDSIADTYDWLFSDWKAVMERQMERLVPLFKRHDVKRVLDCACGTGVQSIGLLKAGFEVVSSDLSEKMLKQAIKHGKQEGVTLSTVQADFRELTRKFSDKFDAVVCMGNSLPHLLSDQEIKKALLNMHQLLNDKGLLVVDIRDLEALFATGDRFMPVRVNAEHGENLVTILYVIDLPRPIFSFHVIYIIQNKISKDYTLTVHSMDGYPIKNQQLIDLISEIGFSNVQMEPFGEFNWFIAHKT